MAGLNLAISLWRIPDRQGLAWWNRPARLDQHHSISPMQALWWRSHFGGFRSSPLARER